MDVVFDEKGTAYALCGNDHEGDAIWVKLGKVEKIPAADVDEKGDGSAPYSTQFPTPESDS